MSVNELKLFAGSLWGTLGGLVIWTVAYSSYVRHQNKTIDERTAREADEQRNRLNGSKKD